jgi:hypothetical protein
MNDWQAESKAREEAFQAESKAREEAFQAYVNELGLIVESTFVPWSQSRNAKPNPKTPDYSLNWRVKLMHKGRVILETDYGAGQAHCPSYKQKLSGGYTLGEAEAIRFECEIGKAKIGRKPILPDSLDVIGCLAQDADCLDSPTYEEWASNLGYDEDSRKGEAIYRLCLEHALKLRAALGEKALEKLREHANER